MLSNKSYLLRAFYDWIVDSSCTPFLSVNSAYPRCQLPQEFVKNEQVILNISPDAVRDLKITRRFIEFKASFSGVIHLISIPIQAALAIYAEENQQGMFFDYEEEEDGDSETNQPSSPVHDLSKSHLRLVE